MVLMLPCAVEPANKRHHNIWPSQTSHNHDRNLRHSHQWISQNQIMRKTKYWTPNTWYHQTSRPESHSSCQVNAPNCHDVAVHHQVSKLWLVNNGKKCFISNLRASALTQVCIIPSSKLYRRTNQVHLSSSIDCITSSTSDDTRDQPNEKPDL